MQLSLPRDGSQVSLPKTGWRKAPEALFSFKRIYIYVKETRKSLQYNFFKAHTPGEGRGDVAPSIVTVGIKLV